MSRLIYRLVGLTLLLGALSMPMPGGAAAQRTPRSNARVVGWSSVPAILARIKPPKFAARDFNITTYGAVADDKSDSTEAIRKAIAAPAD
jgi:polygalacturonase